MIIRGKRIVCCLLALMMAVSSAAAASADTSEASVTGFSRASESDGTVFLDYDSESDRMVVSDAAYAQQADAPCNQETAGSDEIGNDVKQTGIGKSKSRKQSEKLARRYAAEQNNPLHFKGTLVSTVPHRRMQLRFNRKASNISYKTSNKKVAAVNAKGVVTTGRAGVAVITAKNRKYTCHMVVYVARKTSNILRNAANRIRSEQSIKTQAGSRAKKKTIVLAGSSSFDRWTGAASAFPGYYVVNSAISGSKAEKWLSVYSQLIVSYHPSAVVLFVGSNDIGKRGRISGAECAERIQQLMEALRGALGDSIPIFYVSMLINWNRRKAWAQEKQSNRLMRQYCGSAANMYYIDVASKFLDKNGRPVKSLFEKDRLHPNKKGYRIFRTVIGKRVRKVLGGKA